MNTLELRKHSSGAYETTIVCDGVTTWELHSPKKQEIQILDTLRDKKFFQDYKGDWCLTLPDDHKVFRDKKFDIVIQMAITFIHERDLPHWEDHF